jgi:HEPN domain-containing protein
LNNFGLGNKLLNEAEEYYAEMLRAYERGSWNVVVRRAQEVVELSLKGLLKMIGIEYPKEHDVGDVFERACREKRIEVEVKTLDRIKQTSSRLARERAPAFYMDRLYSEEQAQEAKEGAEHVIGMARELKGKLLSLAKVTKQEVLTQRSSP